MAEYMTSPTNKQLDATKTSINLNTSDQLVYVAIQTVSAIFFPNFLKNRVFTTIYSRYTKEKQLNK